MPLSLAEYFGWGRGREGTGGGGGWDLAFLKRDSVFRSTSDTDVTVLSASLHSPPPFQTPVSAVSRWASQGGGLELYKAALDSLQPRPRRKPTMHLPRCDSMDFIDADTSLLPDSVSLPSSHSRHRRSVSGASRRKSRSRKSIGSSGGAVETGEAGEGKAAEAETRTLVELEGAEFPSLAPTPSQPLTFNIVTLNVGGMRFQTRLETLERYPTTLLGSPLKRQVHYNPSEGEFFFDRHRASFEAILYFYQSSGRIKRPESVPLDVFLKELKFFEMDEAIMDKFWASEGYIKPEELPMPKNRVLREIWQLMEHPDTSLLARVIAFVSVFVIIVSIVSFCLETVPALRYRYTTNATSANASNASEPITLSTSTMSSSTEHPDKPSSSLEWHNPFFCIEFVCIMWFTVEFVLRFISCPSKTVFVKNVLNIIDIMAIAPFYVNLFWSDSGGGSSMSFAVLRVLRLVRVFRIFKLSRHSVGLQILGKTFAASIQELCLLFFFMLIALVLFSSAVYFAENGVPGSKFTSIPAAFWYSIVTMTTVGYGDLVPVSPSGKVVGTMCAILGVLVLALPVPVIVGNFKHFYRQETKLAHIAQMEDNKEMPEDNASIDSDRA